MLPTATQATCLSRLGLVWFPISHTYGFTVSVEKLPHKYLLQATLNTIFLIDRQQKKPFPAPVAHKTLPCRSNPVPKAYFCSHLCLSDIRCHCICWHLYSLPLEAVSIQTKAHKVWGWWACSCSCHSRLHPGALNPALLEVLR